MAMTTDQWLQIANMGLGFGSGMAQGAAQTGMNKENQQTSLAQMIAQLQQRENENRLQATQMNPLAQQQSRANFAAMGDVVRNAKPASLQFDANTGMGQLSGGMSIPSGGFSEFTKGFFNPVAQGNAEAEFYGAAGMPYDLIGAGYGEFAGGTPSTLLASRLAQRTDPTAILQQRHDQLADSGGGNWFTKALGFAAPMALNFLLPGSGFLASGLGKAAVGAGVGALTGGWKGAAQGAGSSVLADQLARIMPGRQQPQARQPRGATPSFNPNGRYPEMNR